MTVVDTWFMGRIGADAIGGVGLGGIAAFTSVCFGFGLLRAVKVLCAQAVGAGQRQKLPATVGAGLRPGLYVLTVEQRGGSRSTRPLVGGE